MKLNVSQRRRARPSLIPLIDVMLVLLFFFMLATTYVGYSRTPLKLAPGGRASAGPGDPGVVSAVLLESGQLRIGAEVLSLTLAIQQLQQAKEVRLSPAPGVALQALLAGWESLAAAGIKAQLAEGAP